MTNKSGSPLRPPCRERNKDIRRYNKAVGWLPYCVGPRPYSVGRQLYCIFTPQKEKELKTQEKNRRFYAVEQFFKAIFPEKYLRRK